MVSLFTLGNITNHLIERLKLAVSDNIYQSFHIYQMKNLYTKDFENIPNFSKLLYICIPIGNADSNRLVETIPLTVGISLLSHIGEIITRFRKFGEF